jgi:hypothetical protein
MATRNPDREKIMRVAAGTLALIVVVASCESPTEATQGRIVLPQDSLFLERGTGQSLAPTYVAADGAELEHGPLKFSTANSRVAWVSTTGELHAVRSGTTVLTISYREAQTAIPVIVTDTAGMTPSYVAAFPGPMETWPGDSINLSGAVRNKWGEPIVTTIGVIWTSSNTADVFVDE